MSSPRGTAFGGSRPLRSKWRENNVARASTAGSRLTTLKEQTSWVNESRNGSRMKSWVWSGGVSAVLGGGDGGAKRLAAGDGVAELMISAEPPNLAHIRVRVRGEQIVHSHITPLVLDTCGMHTGGSSGSVVIRSEDGNGFEVSLYGSSGPLAEFVGKLWSRQRHECRTASRQAREHEDGSQTTTDSRPMGSCSKAGSSSNHTPADGSLLSKSKSAKQSIQQEAAVHSSKRLRSGAGAGIDPRQRNARHYGLCNAACRLLLQ
eukprot:6174264-Pleurochrysis_carterae.AAC.1